MRILPNFVYRFSFVADFTALDGVYKVLRIESYESTLSDGVDLFTALYEPSGVALSTFEADLDTIRDKRVFKLSDVNDPSRVVLIPEHLQSILPDASIQQYMSLGLACGIGVHVSSDEVQTLKTEIEQTIAAMIGETNSVVVYKIKDKWMTEADYSAIELARSANITTISNAFTDKVSLQMEVDRLRTKITYYETLLKSL